MWQAVRHLRVRSLRLHALTAIRWSCCSCVSGGAAADQFAVRARACAASARTRSACRRSARRAAAHIRKIYTIAAVMAGIAGALLAQTTETVSLETLGFQRSADVLVILILGGAGRLYGGIVGAIIYMVARDQFSGINPQYWYFWIGALLVAVVMFLPNGILGGLARLMPSRRGWRELAAQSSLRRCTLCAVHARSRQELRLARRRQGHRDRAAARRALCADRAERRRQDHADQPDDRHAAARSRPDPARRRRHHRARARISASSAAWCARSRSTRCFPISTRSRR